MAELIDLIRGWLERLVPENLPSFERLIQAMDPIAWTLVVLLTGAIGVGIFFSLSTRRAFLTPDDTEATPQVLLARLKQDPTRLSPVAIISRLGAEATLDLLEYGDQIQTNEWRYQWNGVREELLRLLGQQNAFGPIYALARYYESADTQEPDTIRIRRTVLVHKLGRRRFLEPNAQGEAAHLRIRRHAAEVEGDVGFVGETAWMMPDEPAPPADGPLIEMEPIEFRTLHDASLQLHIRRTPMVGGGFKLELKKRRKMWVVVEESVEWVS
jgi:hypothetical protein